MQNLNRHERVLSDGTVMRGTDVAEFPSSARHGAGLARPWTVKSRVQTVRSVGFLSHN